MTSKLSLAAAFVLLGLTAACSSSSGGGGSSSTTSPPSEGDDTSPPSTGQVATSSQPRNTSPSVSSSDADALRDGNTAFATDLYRTIAADPKSAGKNIFFSPHSISVALAMTYAGARGATETQMATALDFKLPQDRLHAAFDALGLALDARAAKGDFELHLANSVWGAPQTTFVPAYLDTLAEDYGSGVRLTDFEKDPEAARKTINAWVDGETQDKIKDLLPDGSITGDTRLVLVNAVYFKSQWANPFDAAITHDGTFHGVGGDTTAPMMHNAGPMPYAKGNGWQAVSIPYAGHSLSMVAVLPDDIGAFEGSFDGATARSIATAVDAGSADVQLQLPKFKIPGATVSLKDALAARGMKDAFDSTIADFSGTSESEKLFVSDVVHQAFVSVDESGTEAAAATAVIETGGTAVQQTVPVAFDKPFLFFVRDNQSGAILFLGRVETL